MQRLRPIAAGAARRLRALGGVLRDRMRGPRGSAADLSAGDLAHCLNEGRKDLTGKFCDRPFRFFEVGIDERAWCCCRSFLPTSIGDMHTRTVGEIWNSPAIQAIRRSILDGSFEYCNHALCPRIQEGSLPDADSVDDPTLRRYIDGGGVTLDSPPVQYNFSFDPSCNISCPSCRTEVICHSSGPAYETVRTTTERLRAYPTT